MMAQHLKIDSGFPHFGGIMIFKTGMLFAGRIYFQLELSRNQGLNDSRFLEELMVKERVKEMGLCCVF